jgi:hypothetical protein
VKKSEKEWDGLDILITADPEALKNKPEWKISVKIKTPYNKDLVIITDAINLQENQLKPIDKTHFPFFIIPNSEQKNNVSVDSVYLHQTLDNFYEINFYDLISINLKS